MRINFLSRVLNAGFYTQLFFLGIIPLILFIGIISFLSYIDLPFLKLPRPVIFFITVSPMLYFIRTAIIKKWAIWPILPLKFKFEPGRWARELSLFIVLIPYAFMSLWAFIPWPDLECQSVVGTGSLRGEKVIAYYCETWFNEYEQYIQIYPSDWSWVGNSDEKSRWVANVGPSDLGITPDPKTESLLFPSMPSKVIFDGSSAITLQFVDGSSRKINPLVN